MLLVLEICLIIVAWQRGWKGWALLPSAITFGGAYIIGDIMFASGSSGESILSMGLVCDVISIGALIAMIVKPRKKSQYVESAQPEEVTSIDVR